MTTSTIQSFSAAISRPAFVARLVAVAMACSCVGALAQTTSSVAQVTVRGEGSLQKKSIGYDLNEGPMEQVQLSISRDVVYGDLDLRNTVAQDELKRRIQLTASNVCRELYSLYPSGNWMSDTTTCVHGAIEDALKQLPLHVAAAEKSRALR